MNHILICKFSTCQKYFLNPVILPCGHSVCNEHIQEMTDSFKSEKFKCQLCKKEHESPENGFPVNLVVEEMLSLKQHLKDDQKTCAIVLEKLEAILNQFDLIYKDPADFVYDYFFNLKTEIEIERERLKMQIDSIALRMIEKLDAFEKDCKAKTNKISKMDEEHKTELETLKKDLSKWKNELRETDIEVNRVKRLTQKLQKYLAENQNEMNKIQSELLLEKKCFLNIKKFDFNKNFFADFLIDKSSFIESMQNTDISRSKIITCNQTMDLLKLCKFNPGCKFNLIYRASQDGFSSANFHAKCNEKGMTLTIVKEKENSYVFGGFTEQSWDNSGGYKRDSQGFIFSLINKNDMPIKINVTKNDNTIYCNSTYGPTFGGGHDFFIANDSNLNKTSYSNLGHSYNHPDYKFESINAKIFLAGSYNFSTAEVEVYQVI